MTGARPGSNPRPANRCSASSSRRTSTSIRGPGGAERPMRSSTLDRLLAVLVAAMVATGLLTLRIGAPSGAWLFGVHAVLAGALAAAIALKLRASVGRAVAGRHWGRLGLGLSGSLVAIAALIGGYAWAASGRLPEIWPWTGLTPPARARLPPFPPVPGPPLPRPLSNAP